MAAPKETDQVKVFQNEKGHLELTLPVSKQAVELRSPKGKDLKALQKAAKADDATDLDVMLILIELLTVSPKMTQDSLDEMDAEDIGALGVALQRFRVFSKGIK